MIRENCRSSYEHYRLNYGNRRPCYKNRRSCYQKTSITHASQEELDTAFQVTIYRTVKNDATVSVNNQLYECPPGFIGKKVQIRYTFDKPQELILYQNQQPQVKLKPCKPNENANVPALGISFTKGEESKEAKLKEDAND